MVLNREEEHGTADRETLGGSDSDRNEGLRGSNPDNIVTYIPTEHTSEDPKPPAADASESDWNFYNASLAVYVDEWCAMQTETTGTVADAIWSDFTCEFSRAGIENFTSAQANKVRALLMEKGVQVICKRGYSRKKALVECWEKQTCPKASMNNDDTMEPDESNAQVAMDAAAVAVSAAEAAKSISRAVDVRKAVHEENVSFERVEESQSKSRSAGLQGLIKAFGSRSRYSGLWDEDLIGIIEVYELASDMCNLTKDERLTGIPIMLDGEALSYYGSHVRGKASTYEDAVQLLVSWFTSEEQRTRLLQEWHDTKLSAWLRKNPEKSQLAVFRDMSARLSKVQRQLDRRYREDVFLRDQLMTAVDIPEIKRTLKMQVPKTAHEANQKIASLLSGEANSAGRIVHGNDDEAMFGLGQQYKGEAQRKISSGYHRKFKRNPESRRLAKVKGCWVCGQNHLAHKNHPRAEVEKALHRLKGSRAFLSAEDVLECLFTNEDSNSSTEAETSEEESGPDSGMLTREVSDLNIQLEKDLSNHSFMHSCGFYVHRKSEMAKMERALALDDNDISFNGIIIDTGANRRSIMSLNQYRSYCREYGIPAAIKADRRCIFGLGSKHYSVGTAVISIPFDELGLVCDVEFFIMKDNVQSLLSRKDLKNTGIDISVQNDCLHFMGRSQKLVLENDFLYYRWSPSIVLFTYPELVKLHRSFGHPSVSALQRVLRRARPQEYNRQVQDAIDYLTKRCEICTELDNKPKRFKLTVGNDECRFNSRVAADIMYLNQRPVLHVVDEATHYSAALFVRNVSSKEVWKAFLRCWTHVYLGPPDYLRLDQGSAFTSAEFKGCATVAGIELIYEPVESPASMSHVERYHAPLRSAYEKLSRDLPDERPSDILQLAVHCVNNTVGPEGLCPTLCVFGAMPRPARNIPAPKQISRAKAVDAAMNEVVKEQSKRKIALGLKYRGPFGNERFDLDCLHFGAPVRVYRTGSKTWEGPFKFVSKDGETVCVQLPHGRKIFNSFAVKPDLSTNTTPDISNNVAESSCEKLTQNSNDVMECDKIGDHENDNATLSSSTPDESTCDALVATPGSKHDFSDSRKIEIDGLLAAGVFKVVHINEVPNGMRIYGTRWVDLLKKVDSGIIIEKSRLVAQNYKDHQAKHVPTKAPTISRFGQRLALCIAAMEPSYVPYTRDITQAYIQSKSKLERLVFLKPPPEMELPSEMILLALKPLYGIPESGLHWYITYRDHHIQYLRMKPCVTDNCILYRRENGNIPDIVALQVDDSFGVGSKTFLQEEEKHSTAFRTKPKKCLNAGDQCTFNGSTITRQYEGVYFLQQSEKLCGLHAPRSDTDAISLRAKIQYTATICRPDIACITQLLTSDINCGNTLAKKTLASVINHCIATKDLGLKFVELDRETLRIVLFTDASFGNTNDHSSQMGFIIVLADEAGSANIIHYGSKKARRVTRSVMAAELLSLVHGYDEAYFAKHTLSELLGTDVPIDAYVDSRTTFNCVAKNARTIEKRLQIDVASLRQAHIRGELRTFGWIPGNENPADGLTKSVLLRDDHPLIQLMCNNKLVINPTGWAEVTKGSKKEKPACVVSK